MKTIEMETLTPEKRQVVESWFADESSVMLLRDNQVYAELIPFIPNEADEMTSKEEEELSAIFEEAEANYAAGKYITLEEFKIKYADKLSGKVK